MSTLLFSRNLLLSWQFMFFNFDVRNVTIQMVILGYFHCLILEYHNPLLICLIL